MGTNFLGARLEGHSAALAVALFLLHLDLLQELAPFTKSLHQAPSPQKREGPRTCLPLSQPRVHGCSVPIERARQRLLDPLPVAHVGEHIDPLVVSRRHHHA